MSTRREILTELEAMEKKLEETLDSAGYTRGPVNDALKVVIPILQDQNKLMRKILLETAKGPDVIG